MWKHVPAPNGRQCDGVQWAQASELSFWSLNFLINEMKVVYIKGLVWNRHLINVSILLSKWWSSTIVLISPFPLTRFPNLIPPPRLGGYWSHSSLVYPSLALYLSLFLILPQPFLLPPSFPTIPCLLLFPSCLTSTVTSVCTQQVRKCNSARWQISCQVDLMDWKPPSCCGVWLLFWLSFWRKQWQLRQDHQHMPIP